MPKKKLKKKLLYSLAVLVLLLIIFLIYFKVVTDIEFPVPVDESTLGLERIEIEEDFFVCGEAWLKKSKTGLWELFIEGNPFDLGVINGKLTKDLIEFQENAFINQIYEIVPSKSYLNFLKYFVAWFNRDIDKYIDEQYKLEIYGVSYSASDNFDFVGPKYLRILNYHAAHDIGHALQNMELVECTAFSFWNKKAQDSSLIVGRNFDFYVGDEFAENKIVCFIKPAMGHNFMMLTWAGMIGAVSGMNEKGLTVTINAAKSEMPYYARTPVSIVAREILQYAVNIDDAYNIACKYKTFISESFMIGSLLDNKTVIIEKTPDTTVIFSTDDNYIILTNHFQSDEFDNDKLNIENIKTSASLYRFKRTNELINKYSGLDYITTAKILRDQKGLNDKDIGMGNEKAVNQLIAHHSIIFMPSRGLVWISAGPFQLGEYVCYDINKVFKDFPDLKDKIEIFEETLNIPADTFLMSDDYQKFVKFKDISKLIQSSIDNDTGIVLSDKEFVATNPEYFLTYSLLGDYYKKAKMYDKATEYYNIALEKEIPTLKEREKITEKQEESINKK